MKIKTKDMILTALFAALTAVGAFISIPIGNIPVTLQTFFTALAAVILGSRLGMLSQIVYVLIGLIGIPVFAGFTGGFSSIMHPSFGYLIGFIPAAYVIGKISEASTKIKSNSDKLYKNFIILFLSIIIGYAVIYAIGIPYLYFVLNKIMNIKTTMQGAFKMGMLIFIPGDLIKCALAAALGTILLPRLYPLLSDKNIDKMQKAKNI